MFLRETFLAAAPNVWCKVAKEIATQVCEKINMDKAVQLEGCALLVLQAAQICWACGPL